MADELVRTIVGTLPRARRAGEAPAAGPAAYDYVLRAQAAVSSIRCARCRSSSA
jgi:hypothetical protein